MKIVLPSYATNYNLCPFKNEDEARSHNLTFSDKEGGDYRIYWGLNGPNKHQFKKYGVMETGFFNEGGFIDTVGAYQCCSLNTRLAYEQISNFDLSARRSAQDLIFSLKPGKQSKFNATHGDNTPFDQSIILACQNPGDRSIGYVHSRSVYMQFVEDCCKFYGKKLFVKLHPWNSGDNAKPFFDIAKKYNCEIAKCNMSLIEDKEFVIGFNTTMAVDCALRNVPFVQYAMGTFWNCFGIHFSNYNFPTEVTPIPHASKLADFLIHKYCFNKSMTQEKYAKMIRHYASSNSVFPMTPEFSYSNNLPQE